jgi:hypothetical protein
VVVVLVVGARWREMRDAMMMMVVMVMIPARFALRPEAVVTEHDRQRWSRRSRSPFARAVFEFEWFELWAVGCGPWAVDCWLLTVDSRL